MAVGAKKIRVCILLTLSTLVFSAGKVHSQNQNRRVIQLSGIVLGYDDRDSLVQLPGVHIYVPKAGRGTTSNVVGFFSTPVLEGDSIVISSIGYERSHYIVPKDAPEYLTLVIRLTQDVTVLRDVMVTPFPTEEVFKEAVLALNIPTKDQQIDQANLNKELLALMLKTTPMDGPMNQRYYLDQWAASQTSKYQPVTNPLFNPFNWVKFFKSLKTK